MKRQLSVVSEQSLVKRIFFMLGLLLFTMHYSLFTVFADDDAARIQKAYKNIKDIRGSFVQKSHIKDLMRTDTYNGTFLIKKPMKMKWEYRGEKPQEVIINNDEIIIYQKNEKQAFKGRFDRATYGQAPIALLNSFGEIHEEFYISKKNNTLLLKPKRPMGSIASIEIEPSDGEFPISSFIINDSHSNRIEITLKSISINTGIKDSIFDFSLPRGASIYEHNP